MTSERYLGFDRGSTPTVYRKGDPQPQVYIPQLPLIGAFGICVNCTRKDDCYIRSTLQDLANEQELSVSLNRCPDYETATKVVPT